MDGDRFDNLAKRLASGRVSRRAITRALGGGAVGLLAGALGRAGATAAQPACRGAGHPCDGNQTCCAGLVCQASGPGAALRCTACPPGTKACGTTCAACCADSDCPGAACSTGSCVNGTCQQSAMANCCTSDAQCDDGNPCTKDACDTASNTCAHTAIPGCCARDSDCSGGMTCQAGSCACPSGTHDCIGTCHQCCDASTCPSATCSTATCTNGVCGLSPIGDCCTSDGQCDDKNPCTIDSCDLGNNTCVHTAVTRTASDQCHDVGTCDPSTGQCSNPAKVDGTTCTGDNKCFQSYSCQQGTCTGSQPVACAAGEVCNTISCDPTTGACTVATPTDNGTPCSTDLCM